MLCRIYVLRGNLYNITGNVEDALVNFQKSIEISEQNGYQALLISATNDLGNLYVVSNQYEKALETFMKSAKQAKENNQYERFAIALTNAAKACIKEGDRWVHRGKASQKDKRIENPAIGCSRKNRGIGNLRGSILYMKEPYTDKSKAISFYLKAAALLDKSWDCLKKNDSPDIINTAISIGTGYIDLVERDTEINDSCMGKAFGAISFAQTYSKKNKDTRLASYATGYLGYLYQIEGKLDKAAELTWQAISLSKKVVAPESQYRWEWQYANILKKQNCIEDAILAYENAIDTLESIRSEFSNCYGKPQSEMRKLASELYIMYVDVLLSYANMLSPSCEKQIILKTARQAIEKNRVFELREYFKDDCLGSSEASLTHIDQLLQKAVVIYPIILTDRLAIVASFPSISKQRKNSSAISKLYLQNVSSKELSQAVDGFREMLVKKIMLPDLTEAKKLYDWLIRPLEKDLANVKPDTLVFIPGGILRGIPMGALFDGTAFLIESYATAVTPGLTLTSSTKISPDQINILAAGISSGCRGFEPLPGVSQEIKEISSLYNTKVLINKNFSLANFEEALSSGDYNVVHIASHGKFSDHIEDSFILTADNRLTFDKLSDYVGLYRFRENPLELITLSACETAAGNDQAVLGLAGISIKIGARSALATLWAVDDQAASQIVSEFYRELKQPDGSRSIALKRAKQKILKDPVYGHPGYWSPFILINNWL